MIQMDNTILYEYGGGLYINLTNACTNKCKFCIRDFSGIAGYDLWLNHNPSADEVIDELKKVDLSKYNEIVYCGYGEPMIRLDELIKSADYIKSVSNLKIRLNTNGQANLIHKRDVTPELKGRIDIISISLNGRNEAQYNEICLPELDGAYEAMIDFTKKVKAYVPKVIMSVVDTYINDDDIEACSKIAENLGVEFRVRKFEG